MWSNTGFEENGLTYKVTGPDAPSALDPCTREGEFEMLTIYSEDHRLHHARAELYGGALLPAFEKPERADHVLARVEEVKLGPVVAPEEFGLDPLRRVHDAGFLRFLETFWEEWQAADFEGEAMATVWPSRGMQLRARTSSRARSATTPWPPRPPSCRAPGRRPGPAPTWR